MCRRQQHWLKAQAVACFRCNELSPRMIVSRKLLKTLRLFAVIAGALCVHHSDATAAGDSSPKGELSYSQWTKTCVDDDNLDFSGCLTAREGRIASGVIAAAVAEQDNARFLRVRVPLAMQLVHGTRVIVDSHAPLQAPYIRCTVDGCISQYELTAELRQLLRTGQNLLVQTINSNGAPLSFPIPLAGFADASDGAPTDTASVGTRFLPAPQKLLLTKKSLDASGSRLVYRPWTKVCTKGSNPGATRVCFTAKEGRRASGERVVSAMLLEPDGDPKRLLRITLPLDLEIDHGVRIGVDESLIGSGTSQVPRRPILCLCPVQPFIICFPNGCWSDFELTAETLAKLRNGASLLVQAVDASGAVRTFVLALKELGSAGFAATLDGAPATPLPPLGSPH
jgi:invasion protein IalB